MVNKSFALHTNRRIFQLYLIEAAVNILIAMLAWEKRVRDPSDNLGVLTAGVRNPDDYGFRVSNRRDAAYLESRGMIRAVNGDAYNFLLTDVGILTAQLLQHAGFDATSRPSGIHWV